MTEAAVPARRPRRRSRVSRGAVARGAAGAFAAVAAAHLTGQFAGVDWLVHGTKPLLLPALAGHAAGAGRRAGLRVGR
ncbi:hypothetical protein [Streptomyces synnematoformans]|uniref:hypothetical protein n=1 Tax=Streptomyces synnematoformans TaxID=415721 RepID=UPI0031D3FD2F